jgi:hypothetical protein
MDDRGEVEGNGQYTYHSMRFGGGVKAATDEGGESDGGDGAGSGKRGFRDI